MAFVAATIVGEGRSFHGSIYLSSGVVVLVSE